jgi:Ca2+-binding EF-hand superfamily protein
MSIIDEVLVNEDKLSKLAKIMFDALDSDESGQLNRDELKDALWNNDTGLRDETAGSKKKEEDLEREKRVFEEKFNQALEILDSDSSGTIDFIEFKELLRQLLESFNN